MIEYNKPSCLCLTENLGENFRLFQDEVCTYLSAIETDKKINRNTLKNLMGTDVLKVHKSITMLTKM